MTNKRQKEYQEQIKKKKEELSKTVSEWSEDDIQAHIERVANVYRNKTVANKLGNFSWDSANRYFWNTYDGNLEKLSNRLKMGWAFATREDAHRAGLTDEQLTEGSVEGETCVEMSHKNCKAVLLKIPNELYEMNEKVKERIKQNKPILDADGNDISLDTSEDSQRVVSRRKESMIQLK